MFDSLSERLNGVLDRLTRRGALSEADVDAALREVRRALLEADVALDVARSFTDEVKKRAVGIEVIKSVTPGQMVVKIVHDQLIETLGSSAQPIDLNAPAPIVIMMVGLQGSGKNHDHRQDRKRLTDVGKRKVLMASSTPAGPPRWNSLPCSAARSASRHSPSRGTGAAADRRARATGGASWRLRRGDARYRGRLTLARR